jgi:hypothetical protein
LTGSESQSCQTEILRLPEQRLSRNDEKPGSLQASQSCLPLLQS